MQDTVAWKLICSYFQFSVDSFGACLISCRDMFAIAEHGMTHSEEQIYVFNNLIRAERFEQVVDLFWRQLLARVGLVLLRVLGYFTVWFSLVNS